MTFVPLALLMAAVTYPARALPLLIPAAARPPRRVFEYLRFVGPAALAALAGTSALLITDGDRTALRLGVEPLAVLAGLAIVAWRRNLLLGILVAIGLVAIARALAY